MRALKLIFTAFCALVLSACSAAPPWYFDPNKQHHAIDGFKNNYPHHQPSASDFWRWQKERWFSENPKHRPEKVDRVQTDVEFLQNNKDIAITWLGHATVLIQLEGYNILIDPIFSERASPVSWLGPKRLVPLPLQIDQLPRIDLVLISHNHYDHLDLATIQVLSKQANGSPAFVVPLGVEAWFADNHLPVAKSLDCWDRSQIETAVGKVTITMTPAQHWSKRWLFGDRNHTLWGGYVINFKGTKIWFAGDTGYSQDFLDIGQHFGGFDFAMIPIGAYQPRWFMQGHHVDPDEAIRIHRDVGARYSLAVHWGTFSMADETIEQPAADLVAARQRSQLPDNTFETWAIGETRILTKNGINQMPQH